MSTARDLREELRSFQTLWKTGYFEGDPLDPMAASSYLDIGYMSVLHVTYLVCLRPFITPDTVALEIGPGRGAWTKCMLKAKEVWCLDALSADHNGFWEYVGKADQVRYFQVTDFTCSMLPDSHFDYLFSFGCLCHVSFEGITQYLTNLYRKLKPGANCFIMVADYDKCNRAVRAGKWLSVSRALPARLRAVRRIYDAFSKDRRMKLLAPDTDDIPTPGRWYHAGTERTCELLQKLSYRVINPDMGVNHRDPVIHFTRD
jgi:hypothetical protein